MLSIKTTAMLVSLCLIGLSTGKPTKPCTGESLANCNDDTSHVHEKRQFLNSLFGGLSFGVPGILWTVGEGVKGIVQGTGTGVYHLLNAVGAPSVADRVYQTMMQVGDQISDKLNQVAHGLNGTFTNLGDRYTTSTTTTTIHPLDVAVTVGPNPNPSGQQFKFQDDLYLSDDAADNNI